MLLWPEWQLYTKSWLHHSLKCHGQVLYNHFNRILFRLSLASSVLSYPPPPFFFYQHALDPEHCLDSLTWGSVNVFCYLSVFMFSTASQPASQPALYIITLYYGFPVFRIGRQCTYCKEAKQNWGWGCQSYCVMILMLLHVSTSLLHLAPFLIFPE